MKYIKEYDINLRKIECQKILLKHPDKIPIIVKKNDDCIFDDISKKKYLSPNDMPINQFIYIIRKRINLEPSQSLFVMINNKLIPNGKTLGEIYQEEKVGPIVFDTNIVFRKEIFLNDEITVKMYFINVVEEGRKWTRLNEIYNSKRELCAKVISNGSFLDLVKRRVVSPPNKIYEMFLK